VLNLDDEVSAIVLRNSTQFFVIHEDELKDSDEDTVEFEWSNKDRVQILTKIEGQGFTKIPNLFEGTDIQTYDST
jgi:hypothetical protein